MSNTAIRIIYVEDDLNLSMVVKDFLIMKDYIVYHFDNAEDLIKNWDKLDADICLLDIMLPKMDGYQLAKFIKNHDNNIPIVFLSAKNQINDKIQGLKIGADDYITKPFSTLELDLRIKAIIKRIDKQPLENRKKNQKIKLGNIIYDEKDFLIITHSKKVKLTKKENQLLKILITNKNNIVTRNELLEKIWGEVNHLNSRSMDVYLSKIRKLLVEEPNIAIINYHSTGFKLDTSKLDNN
ncbi:MAG: DNA-binding response regulator [Bacteroidetes bacterium]|nr:MAG: DNA-binding response regulator [Bacteroidota bacterium]